MRKIINLLIIISPFVASSQTLKEDKVDEFTSKSVKRTDFETLTVTNQTVSYYQFSKIDSTIYLNLKLMARGKVFSVDAGQKFLLKTDSGAIITLLNSKYQITCVGCGAKGFGGSAAEGIELVFQISQDLFDEMEKYNIIKMRLYTNNGYFEEDIKPKHAEIFKKTIALIE